jgi:hypothetical protein
VVQGGNQSNIARYIGDMGPEMGGTMARPSEVTCQRPRSAEKTVARMAVPSQLHVLPARWLFECVANKVMRESACVCVYVGGWVGGGWGALLSPSVDVHVDVTQLSQTCRNQRVSDLKSDRLVDVKRLYTRARSEGCRGR